MEGLNLMMMDPFISEIITKFFDYHKFDNHNYVETEDDENDSQGSQDQVQLDTGSSGKDNRNS